ncbi:MAG: ATP-dependent zinc metalloprotease FtsH [Coriobacteriia bacterium]|nr:ATP-dependent zinc metalloprotease FtsH [Coriobacteriia bacterium]MBN2821953.1 ATP-dependent zinc metalloprotease FtsH [Coriobacteriia bacterium]
MLVIVALFAFIVNSFDAGGGIVELNASDFVKALKDDRVVTAEVFLRNKEIQGTFYEDAQAKTDKEPSEFTTTYQGDDWFAQLIDENPPIEGYTVNTQDQNWFVSLLVQLVPVLLIVGFMFFILNQMQGSNSKVMSFGKAKAKRMTRDQPRITFKDVAGVDEAVEELQEIKEFLANPGKFQALGAKIPKGVLLVGPPGTGKTLLARAVAGEAGVPFFSISGSDFVEMFVGVGASRVRDLFEQAKAASPCIVFVDELDAVGRMRGAGLGGGNDEREQTLNQLLVEMDGFDIKDNVIIMAATNRPDVLDAALLRPGRFDRQIVVDRPDLKGRTDILRIHTRGKPVAKGIDLEVLARRTPGFTGADLANLVNEAALLAARHGKKEVEMVELEEAIERVIAGPEKRSRLISEKEKRVIAYHEAGHALVGHVLPNTDPIHKISIIARGRALGYTLALPTEDKFLSAKGEMLDEIAMMLGGRVAEEIAIGDITTGASNDIERATKLARQMITRYGMSDKLGPMTLGEDQQEVFLGRDFSNTPNYSQEIAFEIDKEVRRMIDDGFDKANKILTERRAQLDLMAEVLIERETIDKDGLEALLENKWDEFLAGEKEQQADEPEVPEATVLDAEDADERPRVQAPVASDESQGSGEVAPA